MSKIHIVKDVFPGEIVLLILEHFLYDPETTSDWKEVRSYAQLDLGNDVQAFWSAVEPVPGLLRGRSNMRDNLRSIFFSVNTVPLHLRLYFGQRGWSSPKVSLEPALNQHLADCQHIRSLVLDRKQDLLSSDVLQASPNLNHLQLRNLGELYDMMIFRHRLHNPPHLFSEYEATARMEQRLTELHFYPGLCHIELMASPRFWPQHQLGEWAGYLDALKAIASEISSGFAQNNRKVKIEVIAFESEVRGGILAKCVVD